MGRYHFHTDNLRPHHDHEGVELPGPSHAKEMAVKTLAELLRDHAIEFWETEECRLTVMDGNGLILFTIDVVGTVAPVHRMG